MEQLGPYRIERELARGGQGVVLRAHHPQLGAVALKVLHPVGMESLKHRKRFLREAEAAQQLDHPNLVRVREVGQVDGRLYMAQDLIEGESLDARLRREGRLRPREAVRLVAALAEAVHYAHGEGILHRDLKPSNVLLRADGIPLITDFGLVRRLDAGLSGTQLTEEGHFLGTPGYWSPEQARGEVDRFGPATDVYGLGATLFMSLTGEPPQQGASLIELLGAFDRPPPTPGVDPTLDAIVARALAREPEQRYPSAAALAAELRSWLVAGPAPHSAPRLASPTLALALIVVALGVAGAAAVLTRARWGSSTPMPTPSAAASESAVSEPPSPVARDPSPASSAPSWLEEVMEAQRLDAAGDLAGALAAYDRALAAAPDQADLYRARGVIKDALGDAEGALEDLDRSIDFDPTRPLAFFARALVHDRGGDLAGAIADYGRAIELDPRDPRAWHNRGAIFAEQGLNQRSLADLLEAARLGSRTYATYEAIGNHFALSGQPEQALNAFLRATELQPDDAVLWLHLARAYDQTGQQGRALGALERSLALEDRLAATWHYRGQVRFARDEWDLAAADFTRALELDPEQPGTWFSRGAAREFSGQVEGAIADYTRALELKPDHQQARSRLDGLKR